MAKDKTDKTKEVADTVAELTGKKDGPDSWVMRKKPTVEKVAICSDPELVTIAEMAEAKAAEAELMRMRFPESEERAKAAGEAIDEAKAARAAAEAETRVFVFRAIGRKRLEDLTKLHPSTPEQKADFKDRLKAEGLPTNETLNHNPDTFPPALMQAACVDPGLSVEEAHYIWTDDAWSEGEVGALFAAAWEVNNLIR